MSSATPPPAPPPPQLSPAGAANRKRWMIGLGAGVAVVLLVIFGLLVGNDDDGATDTAAPTTGAPPAAEGDEPVDDPADVASETACVADPSSGLSVDGEPGDAPGYEHLRIERVEIVDNSDEWRIEWTLAGDVPPRLRSPGDEDTSARWSIFLVTADGDVRYDFTAQLIGDETLANVTEWDTMQTSSDDVTMTIAGATITVTYPKSLTPDSDDLYWFALTEGDGDPDPDFEGLEDFELYYAIQHRCPAREQDGSFLQGELLKL